MLDTVSACSLTAAESGLLKGQESNLTPVQHCAEMMRCRCTVSHSPVWVTIKCEYLSEHNSSGGLHLDEGPHDLVFCVHRGGLPAALDLGKQVPVFTELGHDVQLLVLEERVLVADHVGAVELGQQRRLLDSVLVILLQVRDRITEPQLSVLARVLASLELHHVATALATFRWLQCWLQCWHGTVRANCPCWVQLSVLLGGC